MSLTSFSFGEEFRRILHERHENNLEIELVGLLTKQSKVYTLSYDSKILSSIFEILCEPIIAEVCYQNDLIFEKSSQTSYPDFTIYKDKNGSKQAVEVKSTYRRFYKSGDVKPFSYTLGSYKSYLRDPNGKKNILYPYNEYGKHWVIGFLYTRNPDCTGTEIKQVIEAADLQTPFHDIEWFVQERYKIAGTKAGSGNTTNIGSIKSKSIRDFEDGKRGFKTQGAFEKFWRKF